MKAEDQEAMDKCREEVKAKLTETFGDPKKLTSEQVGVIQTLFTKYVQIFTHDNNRIWSTGNIFIPLSLAGLLSVKDLAAPLTIFLALGSIALMGFWVLVAENHRAFQCRSENIARAIEEYLGFKVKGGKLAPHWLLKVEVGTELLFSVQNIRWQMFSSVTIIWIAVVVYKVLIN